MQRLTFQCPTHPDENITNFCCLRNCLTPLCPDCIDEHNKMHKSQGEFAEMDTVNRVKKMCNNKLNYTMEQLKDGLDKLNEAQNLNPQEMLQNSINDLDTLRMKMIEQINMYFQYLKNEYTIQFQNSSTQIEGYKDLQDQIQSVIQELQILQKNLDNRQMFESIKQTTGLDSEQLVQVFENNVQQELSKSVQLPCKINVDEKILKNFQSELRKIVQVDKDEIKVVTNEHQLFNKPKKKDLRVSEQINSYFNEKFRNM